MKDDWKFICSATILDDAGKPVSVWHHVIRPVCTTLKDSFLYPLSLLVRKFPIFRPSTKIRLYSHNLITDVKLIEVIDYETAACLLQGYDEEKPLCHREARN